MPGKPQFFATAFVHDGAATGLLVESHEGRPTKIEGNPFHPGSLGATDAFAQASILTLYDPDRSQAVTNVGSVATWNGFFAALNGELEGQRLNGGAGLQNIDRNGFIADSSGPAAIFAQALSQGQMAPVRACQSG